MKYIPNFLKKDSHLFILICMSIFILLLLYIFIGSRIYTQRNIISLLYQTPEFGILTIGMMLAMLCRGIDLSIIANANTVGIFAALILTRAWLPFIPESILVPAVIFIALGMSTIFGLFNGLLIAKLSIPPMLATLGTMMFYAGIGMSLTSGKSIVNLPSSFTDIGVQMFISIPVVFLIFLAIGIIVQFILGKTMFGRITYLYGDNPTASRFSGIKNEKLLVIIYSLIGTLSGIAGLIIISRVNSAKVGYGDTYLLQSLLVCVIGGVDPNGGKGNVIGLIIAILCVQLLGSAFTVWQLSPYTRKLILGSLLVLVMAINYFHQKYTDNKQKKLV